jgi:hypothetical protein
MRTILLGSLLAGLLAGFSLSVHHNSRRARDPRPSAPPPPRFAPSAPRHQAAPPPPFAEPVGTRRPRPTRLSEVATTRLLEQRLDALGPNARPLIDQKLGLLAGLETCLAGRVTTRGAVELFVHYQVDPARAVGQLASVELVDSRLSAAEDDGVRECTAAALRGRELHFEQPPEGTDFHWSTRITFPLGEDFAYRLVAASGS